MRATDPRRRSGARLPLRGSIAVLGISAAAGILAAQDSEIQAGPNHIVSVPRPGASRNEVWLAASHRDPRTFVAVFHANNDVINTGCESAVTKDGGQTWRRFTLIEEGDCFDPTVVSGAAGQFYVAYSAWRAPKPELGAWRGQSAPIRVYTSLDDGGSWSPPLNLITPLRPDHQRGAVDLTGGKFDGRVYFAWVEFPAQTVPGRYHLFLHTLDPTGRIQSEPHLVQVTEDVRPDALEPMVLSDGTLLLPVWGQSLHYFGTAGTLDPTAEHRPVYLLRSIDGGQTFGPVEPVVEVGAPMWRTRLHRFFGQANPPIFAVDGGASSRFRDRIYAVWSDVRAGRTNDVWLLWSGDKGRTWSPPVKVNDFADPETEGRPPDVRVTPVVAINADGVVAVAWYDRRDDPTRRCWKQYVSASLDGGRTWLKNQPVATAASCPPPNKAPVVEVYRAGGRRPPRSWDELRREARRIDEAHRFDPNYGADLVAELAEEAEARVRLEAGDTVTSRIRVSFDSHRDEFQGHYGGLAASTDGSFLAVWADSRRGNQEMFGARFTVTAPAKPPRALEPRKLNDQVDVLIDEVSYDGAAGITTMQVAIRNRSSQPIYPPLKLSVKRVVVGDPKLAVGGDNPADNTAPEWDFSALIGLQNRLDPGMVSEPHPIKLKSSARHGLDLLLDYEVVGNLASRQVSK